jgi:hypothetical protein
MGKAERIDRLFAEDSFDLVHARNCLDHSIDPLKAIYHGSHQWNICEENSSLVLWGQGVKHNLSKLLNESCSEIHCNLDRHGWMHVRIRKRD